MNVENTNQYDQSDKFWDRRRLIRESALSAQEKWLVSVIADYAGNSDECFAKQETLANDCSLSRRHLRRVLSGLEGVGVLKIERRGKRKSNLYAISWDVVSRCGDGTWLSAHRKSDGTTVSVPYKHPQEHPHRTSTKGGRFKKPTVDDVAAYCQQRGNTVDTEAFDAFYESKGWVIGQTKMKNWKACVRTWESRKIKESKNNGHATTGTKYDPNETKPATF